MFELLQEDPSEVVPLPEEMMKSLSVVMLSPGGDDSSPSEVKKKKDRRRLRHERWLKSKNCSSALITVWWPNQLTSMILPSLIPRPIFEWAWVRGSHFRMGLGTRLDPPMAEMRVDI